MEKTTCSKQNISIIVIAFTVMTVFIGLILYFHFSHSKPIVLPENPLLASSTVDGIVLIDWSKKDYTTVVEKLASRYIRSFDYSTKHKILFYGLDNIDEPIKTWNDKYERSLNYTKDWTKTAMVVDDFNDKLYVLDSWNETLWMIDVKSGYYAAVLTRLDSPKDIAMDTKRRLFYILEQRTINVYAMDEGRIHKIGSIEDVDVFTIDQSTRTIYYTSSFSIMSIDDEGRKNIITHTNNIIEYITLQKFGLFHIAHTENINSERSLSLCQLYNEAKACIKYEKINDDRLTSNLLKIKSYSSFLPQSETPCDVDNGGCQQLCILYQLPYDYRCICNDGWILADDGVSCNKVDKSY